MTKPSANIAASIRARLFNQSRALGLPFDLVLVRYMLERLLYRLSISDHADRFVLKGVMLLTIWFDDLTRPTRDLDLHGYGDSGSGAILAVFQDILAIDAADGVQFDVGSLKVDRIRKALVYGGVRLCTNADIGSVRVLVAIDIGFGDALEPGLDLLDYPVMLDQRPFCRVWMPHRVLIRVNYQG